MYVQDHVALLTYIYTVCEELACIVELHNYIHAAYSDHNFLFVQLFSVLINLLSVYLIDL